MRGSVFHRVPIIIAKNQHPTPMDATIMSFLSHLRVRGKACEYEVTRSDGKTTTVLAIPHYDFNWQLFYRYFEPLTLKAVDAIRFTAWYDKSHKIPANPDPSKTVRWVLKHLMKCTSATSNTTSPAQCRANRRYSMADVGHVPGSFQPNNSR
jgi:hypothetical protein